MNNKRKRQQEYTDQIDFNPSLYPSEEQQHKKRVFCNDQSSNHPYHHHPYTMMNRRKNRNSYSSSGSSAYGSSSASNINTKAVEKMFDVIAEEDDPSIATMEGICTIAENLNIDPMEDVRILVLLHKLGANAKPGQISREEWKKGCQDLQADSIEKMKDLLPSFDTGFMVDSEFRDFYKFCFQFNRQGTHKTLEKDLVIGLLEMTLKGRIDQERVSSFIQFLNETKDASYDRITLDQWLSFLDFSKECTDLNEYDEENSAWPVLIDDFVDYAVNSMQM